MDPRSEILTTPQVSITMATYNRASYIAEAIASVCAQTYTNWELIIVDDGSTDETAQVVRQFDDARIRYIASEHNEGIVATRTKALAQATGKYIAVLDSDDIWSDPTKLATQVAFLEAHPDCVIVGTFAQLITATGASLGETTYETTDAGIRAHILGRNQFAHSSVLMRRDSVQAVGGYLPGGMGEDLELFLRLGTVGTFTNLPHYMTSYRIHTESMSYRGTEMAHAVLQTVWKNRSLYPHALPALIKSLVRLLLSYAQDTRTLRVRRTTR